MRQISVNRGTPPPLTALIGFNYGMLDDYGSICKAITGLVDINNL